MNIYQYWKNRFPSLNRKKQQKHKNKQKKPYVMIFCALCTIAYASSYAGTDTRLNGDDIVSGALPIGFDFNYYGKNYNKFYVSTNGLLQFENPTTSYSNYCLPALNNTLYVFWDDLRTNVAGKTKGTIKYETQGEAPERKLIVQWTNQYFYGSNLPMGTFQAILYEGSNQIKYQYSSLNDNRSKGKEATIGIQGMRPSNVQIGCNKADTIKPEQAILFTPNGDLTDYSKDENAEYEFIDISGLTPPAPKPAARYSNQAPAWSWQKIDTLNTWEIEIQDASGNSVHKEVLNNINQFTFNDGLQNGKSYRARVRGSINNGGTWEPWSVRSGTTTIDTTKPDIELNKFNRVNENAVRISYTSSDNLSGIASVHLQIANNPDFNQPLVDKDINVQANSVQIDNMPSTGALYARLNAIDKAGNSSGYTQAAAIVLTPPVLISPVTQTKVKTAQLKVQGTAESGSKVQLYLNNQAIGQPAVVDAQGYFNQDVQLNKEGSYRLHAVGQNDYGHSEPSAAVSFDFALPTPTGNITTPGDNQTLAAPVDIQVDAADELGIEKVELLVDDKRFATLTERPYQAHWPLTMQDNGSHKLTAKVTNTSGKTVTSTRTVKVKIEPPAPPPTPYTGKVTAISPAVSYGPQPVTITGQALYRADNTAAASVPLKLVLNVKGFERKIAVATDENGHFSYTFTPQESDSGTYQVGIIHPDEKTVTHQGSFAINRIAFNIQGYQLKAPRTITTPIQVNATASTGAKKLRWVLAPENQPDGVLPQGINIQNEAVDIAPGQSRTTTIKFTADNNAAEKGSLYLVAFAEDSGDLVRGKLQINYQLGQPMPDLYASPSYIQTGLQQNTSTTANVSVGNKGLAKAENVQIELVDKQGNPAPSWVFIASDKNIDAIAVDEKVPVQIMAQPDNSIADGIYNFIIRVSTGGKLSGTIPVSISVTQSGQGIAQFDVADIYTATLDAQGQPIKGVKGATIKLQNDGVLTEQYTLNTDKDGIASLSKLPAGIYRYRVSAPNHIDASGRIVIQPDSTTNQHIFLEYQTVNVEFNVTETTIKDVYDINVNASFNTQVPAPVILLEPLSINLGGMQVGEEKTGQITVSNYGLVQADNVSLNLPKTDSRFKYEFFGEVPSVLKPKEKVVISYKVTALDPKQPASAQTGTSTFASLLRAAPAEDEEDCTSYEASYQETHQSECPSGDISKGSSSGRFYQYSGKKCSTKGASWGWAGGGSLGGGGGSFGSGAGAGSPAAMPITPGCTPDASCSTGGTGSGAK
jgi:uncharacterized membrane protein